MNLGLPASQKIFIGPNANGTYFECDYEMLTHMYQSGCREARSTCKTFFVLKVDLFSIMNNVERCI